MTVREYIDALKALPQDLPVMQSCDEFGCLLPAKILKQLAAVKSDNPLSEDGMLWVEDDPELEYKVSERMQAVCL